MADPASKSATSQIWSPAGAFACAIKADPVEQPTDQLGAIGKLRRGDGMVQPVKTLQCVFPVGGRWRNRPRRLIARLNHPAAKTKQARGKLPRDQIITSP